MTEPMPTHAIRVGNDEWEAAMARAKREHRALSDVVRIALRAYSQGRYDAVEPPRKEVSE